MLNCTSRLSDRDRPANIPRKFIGIGQPASRFMAVRKPPLSTSIQSWKEPGLIAPRKHSLKVVFVLKQQFWEKGSASADGDSWFFLIFGFLLWDIAFITYSGQLAIILDL